MSVAEIQAVGKFIVEPLCYASICVGFWIFLYKLIKNENENSTPER